MSPGTSRRWVHALVIAAALGPLAGLVCDAFGDGLGANPIETVTHTTGRWGLRLLLATLAVTPLRRLVGWRGLAPYRRTLGLLAFGYAALHLATWLALDHFFDWTAIADDVVARPFVTVGLVAFAALLPLAITSTRGWIRRLGRGWVRLHRLVYLAALAAVLHFAWLVKADLREPLAHGAVLAALLALRVVPAVSRYTRSREPA